MTKGTGKSTDLGPSSKIRKRLSLSSSHQKSSMTRKAEDLIRSTYSLVQQEPENLNHYLQLSDLYHRYGDSKNAIAWIQQARPKDSGKGDVSLEEKERTLTLEYYDNLIESGRWPVVEIRKIRLIKKVYKRQFRQENLPTPQLESLVKVSQRFQATALLESVSRNNQHDECLQHFQPLKEMPRFDWMQFHWEKLPPKFL